VGAAGIGLVIVLMLVLLLGILIVLVLSFFLLDKARDSSTMMKDDYD